MKRVFALLLTVGLVVGAGIVCFFLLYIPSPIGSVRDLLVERGTAATGALNLVTAIYLGYRAFDTLGETIVLVLAVIGVSLLFVREK